MSCDKNSSKISDPNSGEKSIKDKKEQGYVPKDDKKKTGKKTCGENARNRSEEDCETIVMESDSPYYEERRMNPNRKSKIKVFNYPAITSRAGVSAPSRMDRLDAKEYAPTGYPSEEEPQECQMNEQQALPSPKQVILKCPTPKHSPTYNINLPRRGKCVIFNHEYFHEGNGRQRVGTHLDVKAITRTFSTLGFEIVVHNDLLWYRVSEEINKLSQEDYRDCGCICIFVLTHGDAGGRLSAKDASYPFISIWRPFTADNCTTLFGKPKLFFTQACRGDLYGESVRGRSETDFNDQSYTLPSQADFLFSYSTMDGFYSLRERQNGSWYIQTLCDVIDKHWTTHDLVRMLTITSRIVGIEKSSVSKEYLNEVKQMPTITSTLTRDVVFWTDS